MSGGHWERYSAVLVESNRQLREHLDEALRRLRLNADELELAREHNRTLFALVHQRDRQLQAVRHELAHVSSTLLVGGSLNQAVTVESQGGH